MLRFFATIQKELLLLKRDWVGLLVLFVMPAVLVIVITLVQDNAMKTMGQSTTEILFVNNDNRRIGKRIEEILEAFEGIKLVKTIHGKTADKNAVLAAVARGDFQVGLILPRDLTASVQAAARRSIVEALSMEDRPLATARSAVELELHFDPTVLGRFRSAVKNQLQLLALTIDVEEKLAALSELLPVKMRATLEAAMGPMGMKLPMGDNLGINLNWDRQPMMTISEDTTLPAENAPVPTAVQQNVPAWSLFGIFFIVLPMAGSFIKERLCGAQRRMLSMPVSYLTVAVGKVCAYMLVCCVQFSLILGIGRWLLPALGTAPFEIGPAPIAAALVAISAIAAAAGYGILLGTVVNSFEQASMFGPISVVIAAALGGIMVPVYAMPPFMQKLSIISPLGWAQSAFVNLLVRGGGIPSIRGDIFGLLAFALACIGAACCLFLYKYRQGKI